jgi:hypothetical protein
MDAQAQHTPAGILVLRARLLRAVSSTLATPDRNVKTDCHGHGLSGRRNRGRNEESCSALRRASNGRVDDGWEGLRSGSKSIRGEGRMGNGTVVE